MIRLAALIPALLLLVGALAPALGQTQQTQQTVELSTDMVNRFIASVPTMRTVMSKYDGQIAKPSSGNSPLAAFQGYAAYQQAKAEMDAAAGGYGFASFDDWMAVARTTALTIAYQKTTGAQAQAAPALQSALRALEANKSMTEAQKAQIRQRMTQAMSVASGFPTPSENNLAIVQTMGPQIETAMRSLSKRNQ